MDVYKHQAIILVYLFTIPRWKAQVTFDSATQDVFVRVTFESCINSWMEGLLKISGTADGEKKRQFSLLRPSIQLHAEP